MQLDDRRSLSGVALIVAAATLISASVTLASISLDDGASTATLLVLRFALLLTGLLVFTRAARGIAAAPRTTVIAAVVIGVVFLGQTGGYLAAVSFIPIALAVLLLYTYPIFTALLKAAIDRQVPAWNELTALVVAFAGLGIALNVSLDSLDWRGIAFGLGAGFSAAVVLNASERVLSSLSANTTTLLTSIGAGSAAVTLVLIGAEWSWPATERGWWALAASIGTFALFYPAMMAGIQRIGAVPAAILFNLEPPITIVLAAWLLDQQLTLQQHIGAGLVLAAIALAQGPRWFARS